MENEWVCAAEGIGYGCLGGVLLRSPFTKKLQLADSLQGHNFRSIAEVALLPRLLSLSD